MSNNLPFARKPPSASESTSSDGVTSKTTRTRQRGGIAFPYDDLDAAVSLSRVLHDTFGGNAETDQMAGAMGQNPTSGSFTAKVGAARHFGLVTTSKGAIESTALGRRILLDDEAQAARIEAFLNVPLYSALFEAYRGSQLPGDAGLEAKILALGAPEKQAKTARQVFARSARSAGFFDLADDRLVKPGIGTVKKDDDGQENEIEKDPETVREGIGMKPAIVTEVFRRLPDAGKAFTARDRERWMAALTASLDLEYTESDPEPKAQVAPTETAADPDMPL
jgi:hypothetical protein